MENNITKRIAEGDETVFNRFTEFHSSRLYYYAFGLSGRKETAEEIVSDVFLEVWKNRAFLPQIRSVPAWLQTVTYRKAVSYRRKESGKSALPFDEIDEFRFAPVQSPDEEIIGREETAALNKAIEKLPPRCKLVFFLAKIEELPYKEIAERLHISVKTVNYHIAYALDMLARILKSPVQ